jgi:hypothetical protein
MTDTQTTLSRWQDAEGYPTEEYFAKVEITLEDTGVVILDGWRDEPWDYVVRIDPEGRPYERLLVSWVVDEHCDPLGDGFTGYGWCWVPYTRVGQGAADQIKQLDVDYLAEPEQVAAAVAEMMKGGGQ